MVKIIVLNFSADSSKELMPALGLGYLISTIKDKKLGNVKFKDFSFYENEFVVFEKFLDNILENDKLVFCFSMNTHNRYSVRKAADMIKSKFKNSLVLCGGPHITLTPVDTLKNCKSIDFAVLGEGELTIVELLENLEDKTKFKNIKGIAYRENKKIKINSRRDRIVDLDSIGFPDREIMDVKKYPPIHIPGTDPKKVKGTNMIGSRGCPYQCSFCSVADQWGRRTTYRSPQNIIAEIKHLNKEYGLNGIYFFDDTFTLMRKRVIEFCDLMIDEGLNKKIFWFCEARANTLDYELLKKMKEAGCRSMAMGVESSNQWLLDNIIKKGIKIGQVLDVIKWTNELNIKLKCFFTVGHPEETYEMALETLKFRDKIKVYAKAIGFLKIYPGTPLYNRAVELKIIPKDFSWFKSYSYLEWVSYDKNLRSPIVPLFRHKLKQDDYAKLTAYLTKDESMYKIIRKNLKRINSFESFIKSSKLGLIYVYNKIKFKFS